MANAAARSEREAGVYCSGRSVDGSPVRIEAASRWDRQGETTVRSRGAANRHSSTQGQRGERKEQSMATQKRRILKNQA